MFLNFFPRVYFILEESLILFIVQRLKQFNTYLLFRHLFIKIFLKTVLKRNPAKLSNYDIKQIKYYCMYNESEHLDFNINSRNDIQRLLVYINCKSD